MAHRRAADRGKRIRLLREKRGLTIGQLAKECSVSPTYIGLIEKGSRDPGRKLLFALAKLFAASPEFIETGELTTHDQAKAARFELWPELTYLIANHCVVPRLADPEPFLSQSEAIRTVFERAWSSWHFCEFWEWAVSAEGRAAARALSGRGLIESLFDGFLQCNLPCGPARWITLAKRGPMRDRRPLVHCCAILDHAPQFPCDCFEFDLLATWGMWREFFHLFVGQYGRDLLCRSFILKAFPDIFWSAARRWSDRRLAGWFWYLGLPVDLFGPLVAVARSVAVEAYPAAARRLLEQASVDDMDAFLGLFVDLYRIPEYLDRYGRPWANAVFMCGTHRHGFGLVADRRLIRAETPDSLRLQLIHSEGTPDQRTEAGRMLASLSDQVAPSRFDEDAMILSVDRGGRPRPEHPRLRESPPTALS